MSNAVDPIQMTVKGLMLDPSSNLPIVILKNERDDVFLPIWIGVFEANAIAMRMEGVEPPRPMTHDLMRSLVEDLGATVESILITDLRENTFYAQIHLTEQSRSLTVDSRPSDALALALRVGAPIFVLPKVLEKAEAVDLASRLGDEDRLKKWLEEADPAELGKYKM